VAIRLKQTNHEDQNAWYECVLDTSIVGREGHTTHFLKDQVYIIGGTSTLESSFMRVPKGTLIFFFFFSFV
jgi:hypothetical protein